MWTPLRLRCHRISGSAGAIIARRLADPSGANVVLVEAGRKDNMQLVRKGPG